MVKVVFPHFEDKSLDRWMAAPRPVQIVGGVRTGAVKEVDLSEALMRFHIASSKNLANGEAPKVILPPILTSSNAATWLSTRGQKRLQTVSNKTSGGGGKENNDLSKWLVGGKPNSVGPAAEDYTKWLKKSVPTGSSVSSLPGIRVEFPELPLSAFRRRTSAEINLLAGGVEKTSSDIEKWLKRPECNSNISVISKTINDGKNKWLLVSSATAPTSMDVDSDSDDDDDELAQWLLVDRSASKDPVKSGLASGSSSGSIEEWLMAAAADREPSIVVIDEDLDDELDEGSSRLSAFSNFD